LNIANYEIKVEKKPTKILDYTEDVQPPNNALTEVTRAESSYYEDYDLRPYNPDALFQKKGNYDIFDSMRQDDQISSVLNLKKTMVLDSGWVIETENEEIQEFFDFQFNIALDELFERKIHNILSAFEYGFSLTELVFDAKQTKDFGLKFVLTKMPTRPPHTFEFDQDDRGNIIDVRQDFRGEWLHIDPSKFMHYVYQREFDNPYGKSEFNTGVYRNWWSKEAIIKFWNIYNERFGAPLVVGKYTDGNTQNIDKLEKMIKNIQARTGFVIPDSYTIDYLQKTGQGESDFERAVQYYNMMIARSMLIPDLLGFSGEKVAGGSYSLGQEHFSIFWSIIEQIRREVARLINKHIVYPLVVWNWGSNEYAEFKFSKVDEDKKAEQAKAWLEGVKTGKIVVTPEHQDHFFEILEFPEVDEKVYKEEEARKEEMRESMLGGALQEKGKEEKGAKIASQKPQESPDEDEKKDKGKDKQEFVKKSYEGVSKFDRTDYQKLEDDLDRITLAAYEELSGVFKLSVNALVDDIKRRKLIEKKRYDLIDKLNLRHQDKIIRIIKKYLSVSWDLGLDIEQIETFDMVDPEVVLKDDLNEWIEQYSKYLKNVEADFIINSVKPIVIEGIKNGEGVNEVVNQINAALSQYDFIASLPSDEQAINRLNNLVRTFTAKAYNEANRQSYEKMEKEIAAYQYSAVLDHRTSQICQHLIISGVDQR
jgi:phage gp29-like protein